MFLLDSDHRRVIVDTTGSLTSFNWQRSDTNTTCRSVSVIGDNFNDSALSQAVVASTPIDAAGSGVVFPRVASTSTRADLWWTLTVPCGRAEYVGLVGSVVFLGLPSLVHVGSFDSWGGYFIKVRMV